MLRLAALCLLLAPLAGCLFEDCSFETTDVRGTSDIQADASAVSDTLTVVFVQPYEPFLEVFVAADASSRERADGDVRLVLNIEGFEVGDRPSGQPSPLGHLVRGDTLFVYLEGSVSPDRLTEVCSPPDGRLRLDVIRVEVPPGVEAVRYETRRLDELRYGDIQALRDADGGRERPAVFA